MSEAVAALGDQVDAIDAGLGRGVETAGALVARAEKLGALVRENGEGLATVLPNALERLERRIAESHGALDALVPQAEKLAASAEDAAARLGGADALLLRQATTMRALGLAAEERLVAIQEHAAQLEAAVSGTGTQVRQLVDSAGPQLIESLLRVRETAMQASDHAREAFATVIPNAASALGMAARAALKGAIDDGIEAQMAEVATASENAVEATQRATERLMRQLLSIAETTAVNGERMLIGPVARHP